jgi:hypothetical protein
VSEKIITSSFTNNSIDYTSETYNQAVLSCNKTEAERATNHIKSQLFNDKPVLFGVHYTNGTSSPPNNSNRATRHYMVIVGMTQHNDGTSFRFYDPGRSEDNEASATSENNVLKVDDNGCIVGDYNNKKYTISEVLNTN